MKNYLLCLTTACLTFAGVHATALGQLVLPGDPVIFVVDCSYSMNKKFTNAGVDTTHWEITRQTLEVILKEWAGTQQQVGVVLLGHRVGWNVANPQKLERLAQTKYAKKIPEELMPYEDVEILLPLGKIGVDELSQAKEALESIKPWGETPIHLAMKKAVDQFPKSHRGRMVVFTDGPNEIFKPAEEAVVSIDQLIDRAVKASVGVNVLGMDIYRTADAKGPAEPYRSLSLATGGSFHTIANPANLVNAVGEVFAQQPNQK